MSKHIVEQCLLSGPLADKTRILVTHHLDVLPKADHIILLQNGRILEQGTYADLLQTGEVFGQLIAEFGSLTKEEDEEEVAKAVGEVEAAPAQEKKERPALTPGAALMQEEERNTGAIAGDVYGQCVVLSSPPLSPACALEADRRLSPLPPAGTSRPWARSGGA